MNVLYFFLILLIFPYTAMWWKIFPKAGRKSWEALVPLYNYCVASKIGGQPFWYGSVYDYPGNSFVHVGHFQCVVTTSFWVFLAWRNSLRNLLPLA
jgi:hypothetical protein